MAAPEWPAQEARRARPSAREATRPHGLPCGAPRVGSVREGIETVNRGIHSPIYTHYFPFFSPCGTMFPHGLTCAGRVQLTGRRMRSGRLRSRGPESTRSSNPSRAQKGDLSDDNRTTYLAPRGVLRSSRSASIEGLELIAIRRLIFIER